MNPMITQKMICGLACSSKIGIELKISCDSGISLVLCNRNFICLLTFPHLTTPFYSLQRGGRVRLQLSSATKDLKFLDPTKKSIYPSPLPSFENRQHQTFLTLLLTVNSSELLSYILPTKHLWLSPCPGNPCLDSISKLLKNDLLTGDATLIYRNEESEQWPRITKG